eukprot:302651_1
MRNKLAQQYIQSHENGIFFEVNNYIDCDEFCEFFVQQIQKAENYFRRKANWNILVKFVGRFACVKKNDELRDISFKHWYSNDIEMLDDDEFEESLYRAIERTG